jgi:opacity protein-like surface antigen
MRRSRSRLLSAAAMIACAALPALADGPDFRTGISPYGAATPVPAPIPVPFEEAAWYFRADFAAGFGSQPSVTAFGTPFGSGSAAGTIGLNPAWLSESFEPAFTGGVGVGYVWGPHFRTDFTVDIHSTMNADFVGTATYNNGAGQSVYVTDKTKFASTILLVNGYYDIRTGTPFSPYIGGGVGFTVDQLTQEIAGYDSGVLGADSVGSRSTQIKFAGAAMAGLTYDINTFVSIDVGYRFLYIGGSDVDSIIYSNSSKIEIGSVNEHQIRAGLRFYVN